MPGKKSETNFKSHNWTHINVTTQWSISKQPITHLDPVFPPPELLGVSILLCLPASLFHWSHVFFALLCSPAVSGLLFVSSLTPVLPLCASCSASWGFLPPFLTVIKFLCFCLFLPPSPLLLSPPDTLPSSSETPGGDASFQLLLSLCSSCHPLSTFSPSTTWLWRPRFQLF